MGSETTQNTPSKAVSVLLLVLSQIAGMSLWFISSAILTDMLREVSIPSTLQAMLASAVQAGFVVGALTIAVTGIADRFDPRRVFFVSAIMAALANMSLLILPTGGEAAVLMRFLTGLFLAGVYPVGMKLAAAWGVKDRGFLIALLVGALTLGSAMPHLFAFLGGTDWRVVVSTASLVAAIGGALVLMTHLGPHYAKAQAFDPKAISLLWRDQRIRAAFLGYMGHMWELYAMWAWLGTALTGVFLANGFGDTAQDYSKITVFFAIAVGALACIPTGRLADRIGKPDVTIGIMLVSGLSALAVAASLMGPVWLVIPLALIWGASVIPDSPQFSALIADYAPAEYTGSLLSLQTAFGFLLTVFTVQVAPYLADIAGWQTVIAAMALGPLFGIVVMWPLRQRLMR